MSARRREFGANVGRSRGALGPAAGHSLRARAALRMSARRASMRRRALRALRDVARVASQRTLRRRLGAAPLTRQPRRACSDSHHDFFDPTQVFAPRRRSAVCLLDAARALTAPKHRVMYTSDAARWSRRFSSSEPPPRLTDSCSGLREGYNRMITLLWCGGGGGGCCGGGGDVCMTPGAFARRYLNDVEEGGETVFPLTGVWCASRRAALVVNASAARARRQQVCDVRRAARRRCRWSA